jgi:hypothetical protein
MMKSMLQLLRLPDREQRHPCGPRFVRLIVRERGTKPAKTVLELAAHRADSFGSCRLGLYGV